MSTDSYFRRVKNLPTRMLADEEGFYKFFTNRIDQRYVIRSAKDVLSPEALSFFASHNLNPSFVAFFGNNHSVKEDETWVHSDLTRTDNVGKWKDYDPFETKTWRSIICALNFETRGVINNLSWYNVPDSIARCMPAKTCIIRHDYLNGVQYGERVNKTRGLKPVGVKVATTVIDQPTLVRTDMPHIATYNSPECKRMGVSIRFHETWTNWEEACAAFANILI